MEIEELDFKYNSDMKAKWQCKERLNYLVYFQW